jgi:hypothetical protein
MKAETADSWFITCVGTRALYDMDVKGHKNTFPADVKMRDVVTFEVHLNAKNQPQVMFGTLKRVLNDGD